jgi:hypothetical protein
MSRLATTGAIVLAIATLASCSTLVEAIGSMINAGSIGWAVDAQEWKGRNNQVYSVTLPAGGAASEVWGTDVYTDDSSIGSAAVHKGLITFAKGGTVKIRILPGRSSYAGSIRNGVTSEHYDDWDGSFEFVTN